MPNFTVIIPVYNVENYLSMCLDSILAQEDSTIEIIAVNDASSDGSLGVLTNYQSLVKNNERVSLKIINHDVNKGPAVARNNALSEATGEYIAFIDGDDYVSNDAFISLSEQIKSHHPDVIIFPYKNWRESTNTFEELFPDDKKIFSQVLNGRNSHSLILTQYPELLTLKNYVCTKIYRTAFIREHNIKFPDIRLHEDVPFHWQVLIKADKIVVIDNPIYIHRIFQREDGQQASNVFNKQRFDIFAAFSDVEKFLRSKPVYIEKYYESFLVFKLDVLTWISNHIPDSLLPEFKMRIKESLKAQEFCSFSSDNANHLISRIYKLSESQIVLNAPQKIGVNIFRLIVKPFVKSKQYEKLIDSPVAFFVDSKNSFTRFIGFVFRIIK